MLKARRDSRAFSLYAADTVIQEVRGWFSYCPPNFPVESFSTRVNSLSIGDPTVHVGVVHLPGTFSSDSDRVILASDSIRWSLRKPGVGLDDSNGSPGQDINKPTETSVGDNRGMYVVSGGSESLSSLPSEICTVSARAMT